MALTASETIRNHAAFIWSVADLLRGDYKQSEYGRVILPLVVLRHHGRHRNLLVVRSVGPAGNRSRPGGLGSALGGLLRWAVVVGGKASRQLLLDPSLIPVLRCGAVDQLVALGVEPQDQIGGPR